MEVEVRQPLTERAYEALTQIDGATVPQLTQAMGYPQPRVRRAVKKLVETGRAVRAEKKDFTRFHYYDAVQAPF